MLLDLSAAFDTINHKLLIRRLKDKYQLGGMIIKWIESYLSGRSFRVKVNNSMSEECILEIGVPQGSILGPLFFIMYTKELETLASRYGFNIHLYADDTQIYVSFDPKTETRKCLKNLQQCFADIKKWMADNFLKMNDGKTEIMEIHPNQLVRLPQPSFSLGSQCTIKPAESAKNLGFYFDSTLSLDAQITHVKQTAYMNLRNLGRIASKLDRGLKIQLVHSCIHSLLDYCNGTFGSLSDKQIHQLQKIQNSAARFIFGLKGKQKRQPITPYLKELHFLPVRFRIKYKISLTVFKCVNDMAPTYLRQLLSVKQYSRYETRRDCDFLLLEQPPQPRLLKTVGAFHHIAPKTWNELPLDIRALSDIHEFKKDLKTFYFTKAFSDSNASDIEICMDL